MDANMHPAANSERLTHRSVQGVSLGFHLNRRLLCDVALPHAVRGFAACRAPQPQTVLENLLGFLVLHIHHTLAAVGCSAEGAKVSALGMHAGSIAASGSLRSSTTQPHS